MKKIVLFSLLALCWVGCKKEDKITFQQQCENSIKASLISGVEENVFWQSRHINVIIFNQDTKDATDIKFNNFAQINIPLSEIDSMYYKNSPIYPIPKSRLAADEELRKRYTPINYSVKVSFVVETKLTAGGGKQKYNFVCYLNDKAQIMGCLDE